MQDPNVVDSICLELMALLGTGRQIEPFSDRLPDFSLADAYRIVSRVAEQRRARGESPVGRKIGFTNRSIWGERGISAPIWNYVFDATVREGGAGRTRTALDNMPEPRIEPELVVHFATAPDAGMMANDLVECIDWVAPAFEVVYSIFPDWAFTAADAAAAFGVHGNLILGERLTLTGSPAARIATLSHFTIELTGDAGTRHLGHAQDVLGGPLEAIRFLIEEIARHETSEPVRAGEIVSTGTLTEAMPARPGACWTATFTGIALTPLTLCFD